MIRIREALFPKAAIFVGAGLTFAAGGLTGSLQATYRGWDLAKEKQHVKRREDPATWNMELFAGDKEVVSNTARPLSFGVFPNPNYDLIGHRSFRGAGTMRTVGKIGGRYVHGNAFFTTRSPVNEKFIGDRKDEVFFQVLILSDGPLEGDGVVASSQIASRNHPHIVAQGQLGVRGQTIDYVAFQTADRNAYSIVNMRLFDLPRRQLGHHRPSEGRHPPLQADRHAANGIHRGQGLPCAAASRAAGRAVPDRIWEPVASALSKLPA